MKVYCSECKHFWGGYNSGCEHPNNKEKRDTYLEIEEFRKLEAFEINKNNDCEWFEEE